MHHTIPRETKLISLPANIGSGSHHGTTSSAESRSRGCPNGAVRAGLSGTILAHLLPQNATKRRARAPVSHCVCRGWGVPVGVTLGLLIRWSTVRFRHAPTFSSKFK